MLALRNLSSVSLKTRRDFGRQEPTTPTEIVTENNESVSFFRKNFGRQETVIPDPEIITEEVSPVSFLRKNFGRQETVIPDPEIITEEVSPVSFLRKNFGRQEPIIETITNEIISIRPNHNKTRRNFRDGGSAIATVFDPNQAIVHLHLNGANNGTTFTDEVGATVTPNGNVKTVTAQSKFNGSSAYFDGSGDYLSIPYNASSELTSGDFTISFWIYSSTTTHRIAGNRNSSGASQGWLVSSSATSVFFNYWKDNTYYDFSGSPIKTNRWNHIVLQRSGNNYIAIVNGVNGEIVNRAIKPGATGGPLNIGRDISAIGTANLNGYLQEFVITSQVLFPEAFNTITVPTASY